MQPFKNCLQRIFNGIRKTNDASLDTKFIKHFDPNFIKKYICRKMDRNISKCYKQSLSCADVVLCKPLNLS